MKQWFATQGKSRLVRLAAPVLAVALAAGAVGYRAAQPASAGAVAPPAAPLDTESVSALLALDKAMEAVAERVTPAVVNVAVVARPKAMPAQGMDDDDMQRFFQFFGPQGPRQFRPQPRVERGQGSGVVISPDGYIVTNEHVVDSATDIRVTFSDRRVMTAKLVGADPMTDLAVIKVSGTNLPNIPWGDSTVLRPGQSVLAFGNPYGFRFTVTRGIVSALNRSNPFSDDARKPGAFIQTDAAINPGNSGGALVNARGELVGINTFLVSPSGTFSGMGFAIPTQIARATVETLVRDGKVAHAYIGVGITDVTPENAEFFHLKEASGAVITQVEPGGPASRAGLKTGDVITAVDGQKVTDASQLQVVVGQKRPRTKIDVQLLRDGKSMTVPVTVDELGKDRTEEVAGGPGERGRGRWGIGLDDLTADTRRQLRVPESIRGAIVTNVEPGSPADNAGLARGQVIVEVNRKPVQSAADVRDALGTVPQGKDAMVLVWANGGSTFLVMHPSSATTTGD